LVLLAKANSSEKPDIRLGRFPVSPYSLRTIKDENSIDPLIYLE